MLVFTISPGFRAVVAGALGRDATLTDRTLIWDAALKSGSNPIFGEGFEGYWLSGKGAHIIDQFHVQYAHSGYVDKYLDTGLIGLFLFAGLLYAAGRNAASHYLGGSRLGYLFLSLFWCSLLFNYTEISFGRSNVFGLIVTAMVVYGPLRVKKPRTSPAESHNFAEATVFIGS
jgi:O-antigen ligase